MHDPAHTSKVHALSVLGTSRSSLIQRFLSLAFVGISGHLLLADHLHSLRVHTALSLTPNPCLLSRITLCRSAACLPFRTNSPLSGRDETKMSTEMAHLLVIYMYMGLAGIVP